MLVSKQWSRIVGGVVASFVFLLLLKAFHDYDSFREVFHIPAIKLAASQAQPVTTIRPMFVEPSTPLRALQPTRGSVISGSTILQAEDATNSTPVEISKTLPTKVRLPEALFKPQLPLSATRSYSAASELPSPNSTRRKTIVMGKTSSEDTDWVRQELEDWESSIYIVDLPEDVDSPTGFKTRMNKANEATPYLTYIIEHYTDLPDIAVFLHAHRTSWHNDGPQWDAVRMLRGLHLSVVEQRGFVNLRCMGSPGCPNEIQLNRFPVDETLTAEIAYPFVYGEYFNMTIEEVRKQVPIIATPCCAQFAVSREQVLQRPKSDYERLLKLIADSDVESHVLGTVLEYMWHVIFGQDPVHCEQEQVCRDALYGYGSPGDWA